MKIGLIYIKVKKQNNYFTINTDWGETPIIYVYYGDLNLNNSNFIKDLTQPKEVCLDQYKPDVRKSLLEINSNIDNAKNENISIPIDT